MVGLPCTRAPILVIPQYIDGAEVHPTDTHVPTEKKLKAKRIKM